MADSQNRIVPGRITAEHGKWTRQVKIVQGVHWLLVVVATTTSVLAASGIGKGLWGLPAETNLLSVLAAIAIALVSAFELGAKANNFRNAWRLLQAAIMRYELEPSYTEEQLITEYEKAEKLIGDTKAST